MNKIILVLCLFLAGQAKGQIKDLTTYNLNVERSDDYIKLNRMQYAQAVQNFDLQMENFKAKYTGRIEGMQTQLEMTTASVVQMEERLNPLELMGDVSNKCVVKYRTTIPTVATTANAINSCINQASAQLTPMLTTPLNYRNAMQAYFTAYFEAESKKCGEKFAKATGNYTNCITTVITQTNNNLVTYQKTFSNYMDAAECTSKANIKQGLDCTYTVQSRTNAVIAEANVLINNCLLGKDEWKPCPVVCPDSRDFLVNYTNQTILNPFYGLQTHKGCLLLNLKDLA